MLPHDTVAHVRVQGSLDVPLHCGFLADLNDPQMVEDILKDSIGIAVSERLGYFDAMEVQLAYPTPTALRQSREVPQPQPPQPPSSSRRSSSSSGAAPSVAEVRLDLDRLGLCIVAIQKAYEGLLLQAHVLHQVLGDEESSNDLDRSISDAERLTAARRLIAEMVSDRSGSVVEEAKTVHASVDLSKRNLDELGPKNEEADASLSPLGQLSTTAHDALAQHDKNGDDDGKEEEEEEEDAEMKRGLLCGEPLSEADEEEDSEDEAGAEDRYRRAGYVAL